MISFSTSERERERPSNGVAIYTYKSHCNLVRGLLRNVFKNKLRAACQFSIQQESEINLWEALLLHSESLMEFFEQSSLYVKIF